jgi:hypothetical protein
VSEAMLVLPYVPSWCEQNQFYLNSICSLLGAGDCHKTRDSIMFLYVLIHIFLFFFLANGRVKYTEARS